MKKSLVITAVIAVFLAAVCITGAFFWKRYENSQTYEYTIKLADNNMKAGDEEQAEKYYQDAIKIKPDEMYPYKKLIQLYISSGRQNFGAALINSAVKDLSPEQIDALNKTLDSLVAKLEDDEPEEKTVSEPEEPAKETPEPEPEPKKEEKKDTGQTAIEKETEYYKNVEFDETARTMALHFLNVSKRPAIQDCQEIRLSKYEIDYPTFGDNNHLAQPGVKWIICDLVEGPGGRLDTIFESVENLANDSTAGLSDMVPLINKGLRDSGVNAKYQESYMEGNSLFINRINKNLEDGYASPVLLQDRTGKQAYALVIGYGRQRSDQKMIGYWIVPYGNLDNDFLWLKSPSFIAPDHLSHYAANAGWNYLY